MFCKNCGAATQDGSVICTSCGFDRRDGNGFCQHCGHAVLPKQRLCLNCGLMLDAECVAEAEVSHKKGEQGKIDKYKKSAKKIYLYKMIQYIACILFAFVLLFFPLFKCEYKMSEREIYEELESALEKGEPLSKKETERLEMLFETGGVEKKSFSYVQEAKRVLHFIENDAADIEGGKYLGLMASMTLILVFYFCIACIIVSALKTFECYKKLRNLDSSAMMMYTEINKSGKLTAKTTFWTNTAKLRNGIIGIVMDFVLCLAYKMILFDGSMSDEIADVMMRARYMMGSIEIAWGFFLALVLLIGSMVVQKMGKNEEEMLLLGMAAQDAA